MKRLRWMDVASVLTGAVLVLTVAFGIVARRFTAGTVSVAPRIVLDPGHGGEDGGASGADGTSEKEINLAVSRPLGDLLTVMGFSVTYTRTEDTMVNAVGNTLRERKVSDMKNRLALIEQADLAISLHQNNFPQPQYSGTQVFYGTASPQSQVLAAAIQEAVATRLQPQNTRQIKAGSGDIYLLKHTTRPMVLVECGFLSNEQERERLKTTDYQRRLAFAIAGGVLVHLS